MWIMKLGMAFVRESRFYLVQYEPRINYGTTSVGIEISFGNVVYDRFVASLVSDKVHVIAEVLESRQWIGVLQARHTRWLGELVVIHVVANHHVNRFSRTVRRAANKNTIQLKRRQKILERN